MRNGQPTEGMLDANSVQTAASQLSSEGIIPVNIVEVTQANSASGTSVNFDVLKIFAARQRKKKPKLDDLILFCRQMYTLMHAGVPIIRAINGLASTTRNPLLSDTLHDVIAELEAGHNLSAAFSHYPDIFNSLFVSMVSVGENTGNTDEVFLQMAYYLEREKITREQVKSAMRYPTIVIAAISIAMIVINIWVIPTFAQVFASLNAELPLPTQILLGISGFTVKYWWLLAAIAFGSFMGFKHYIKTESGHFKWDRWKTRIPIMGSILLRATLSRFARAFAMTQRAGVPLIQGLVVVSRATDNVFISYYIQEMRNGIERGDSLTRTANATNMFTPLVLQMLSVGEETGAIDEMLDQVADFYDREVDYDLKNLTSALEPLLIVMIGGMVLVLALGVFLPMWDLIGAAKQ